MSNKDALLREQQELLDQLALLKKEQDLKDKLAAIRRQLDNNGFNKNESPVIGKREKKEVKPDGIPKGAQTWEDYIIKILENLGGKHKTTEVVEYAVKANPDIKFETVENAITGKLSKLFLAQRIGADITVKSKGYDYFALPKNDVKSLFGN